MEKVEEQGDSSPVVEMKIHPRNASEGNTVPNSSSESIKEDLAHYLVKLLAQELKPVIEEVGRALVDEDQRVEDLKDVIKGHEEKIACLERMIVDLKQLLRSDEARNLTSPGVADANPPGREDHSAHSIARPGKGE